MHNDMSMQNPAINEPEGAMAKADLYRAAKSAIKLFELFYDEQQLEGWVQAKISKAADYLDSIYHYMEFQMKFGPQGSPQSHDSMETLTGDAPKLDISLDGVEESSNYEDRLKSLLESAEKKAKKDYDKDGKIESEKDEVWGSRMKAAKKSKKVDETSDTKKKEYRTAAGKDMQKSAKTGDKSKVSKRLKGISASLKDKEVNEGCDDKDVKESKPSAGMSKKEKSSVVKKAKAGKDIGKKGKSFEKVASSAAKQYGSKEKGKKVAAAAMWKQQAKK